MIDKGAFFHLFLCLLLLLLYENIIGALTVGNVTFELTKNGLVVSIVILGVADMF